MANAPQHDIALDYLRTELKDAVPGELQFVGTFDGSLLEGDGALHIFQFTAAVGGNPAESYFVVVGDTEPNYYPAYDLTGDDMYSVHLGTRFMLVVGVGQLPTNELPDTLEQDVVADLARIAPAEPITHFEIAAAFHVENQKHAVCKLNIASERVYIITGDLPLGICRRIDLPPHVVYRLHLGSVIRSEASDTD